MAEMERVTVSTLSRDQVEEIVRGMDWTAIHQARVFENFGDRVVLYTDGLVERRAESIVDSLDRLLRVVPVCGTARTACRELLGLLGVTAGSGDDVCVLTLDRRSA